MVVQIQKEPSGLKDQKYLNLLELLSKMRRVVVAFSGGIDSTLLLYAALESLGPAQVTAATLTSSIVPTVAAENCKEVFNRHFARKIFLQEMKIDPFRWKKFTDNNVKRCYFCKKNMYLCLLKTFCPPEKDTILLDGTNSDDLKADRPGYKALLELNVATPMVEARLKKKEIRTLARKFGLVNFDKPSNSCLATRIPTGTKLNLEILYSVDRAEKFLFDLGFDGCRVRPFSNFTILEIREQDFEKFCSKSLRNEIASRFDTLGLKFPTLSFKERKE